jgi:hypothetical protein
MKGKWFYSLFILLWFINSGCSYARKAVSGQPLSSINEAQHDGKREK